MSVLIKGMEMPKRGMVINIYANGRVTNHFDEFGKQIGTAVPVPPHGRLIDEDALKVSLVYAENTAEWAVPELRAVLMVIDEMPTIIPAEEAPGEDINVPGTYDVLYEEGRQDTR